MGDTGGATILHIQKPTGIWVLVEKHYGLRGHNLKVKEQIRVVRQANPGWMTWPQQIVPKNTALVLPKAGMPFLPISGSSLFVVNKGEGLIQVVRRYCKVKYKQELSAISALQLVPILETTNSIHGDEVEPNMALYMPDGVITKKLGTKPQPISDRAATLHDFNITISPIEPAPVDNSWLKSTAYNTNTNLLTSFYAQTKDKVGTKLIKDVFTKSPIKFTPSWENGKQYIKIKGSSRSLIQGLGFNGTRYLVGSEKYVQAMREFSGQTGLFLANEQSVVRSAVAGTVRGYGTALKWGVGLSVAIDAGVCIYEGNAKEILTTKFAVRAADNATNSLIASGAGTMASAMTTAYLCAGGGSVVPGLGTAVGFCVGLAVGYILTEYDVTWW